MDPWVARERSARRARHQDLTGIERETIEKTSAPNGIERFKTIVDEQ